jgi:hypothetical protein
VWDALDRLLANQFLETADESGVTVWEKELGIHPKDTDTLDERKVRIKSKWALELPYTIAWLRNWLAQLCGADGYDLDIKDYVVRIGVRSELQDGTAGILPEIRSTLLEALPANLWLDQVSLTVLTAESKAVALYLGGGVASVQRIPVPAVENDITMTYTGRIGANGIMSRRMPLPDLS